MLKKPDIFPMSKVRLPKTKHRKLVIFDLDETLVHCVEDVNTPFDLPIEVQNGMEVVKAGINIRPYAYQCLKEARNNYQVVIFTASHKSYADVVIDKLENEFRKLTYLTQSEMDLYKNKPAALKKMKQSQKLIDYRMYRDNCYKTSEGLHIKDLRVIEGVNLYETIIVDNAVHSFGF